MTSATSRAGETPASPSAVKNDGLVVEHLTVRYGGHAAVSDLSFTARSVAPTGLIGPNGAGKTTTFNACSGIVRPSAGNVFIHGQDVTGVSAPARARRGLGR